MPLEIAVLPIIDRSWTCPATSIPTARRQANTVLRLTVVTIFSLIGPIATVFLGMNLLAEAEKPLPYRIGLFLFVSAVAVVVTGIMIAKSKRLADFMDVLSNDRAGGARNGRSRRRSGSRDVPAGTLSTS